MNNFGGIPKEFSGEKNSPIVILPVPYDGTSTWIKGADKGPDAILEASANMELYDIESEIEVYRKGIYTAPKVKENRSPERMTDAVYKAAKKYLDAGKFLVTLGGEHSVTVGTIKAHAENHENMSILQLDAHSDMRNSYLGSQFSHACTMARAKEYGSVVQVGIRSMDIEEKENIDPKKIFYAENIHFDKAWMDKVIGVLSQKVYITIDLDVFDPSVVPSTGTPEPGGLGWYDVIDLVKRVVEKLDVVGFDVVELCPTKIDKSSDFLAAKLIYKILSYKFSKP